MKYLKPSENYANNATTFSVQNPVRASCNFRIISVNDAYVKVGAAATATNVDALIKGGVEYYFGIDSSDYINVFQATTGNVSISFGTDGGA
jgi:hypothetical protein